MVVHNAIEHGSQHHECPRIAFNRLHFRLPQMAITSAVFKLVREAEDLMARFTGQNFNIVVNCGEAQLRRCYTPTLASYRATQESPSRWAMILELKLVANSRVCVNRICWLEPGAGTSGHDKEAFALSWNTIAKGN
jgi:hypothetical protein